MKNREKILREIFIYPTRTMLQAIQMLNDTASQILLVVEEDDRLVGTLTDGDIRKAISEGKALDTPIGLVCNTSPKTLSTRSYEEALSLMNQYGISRVPILNKNRVPVDIIYMEDILPGQFVHQKRSNKVVIMAGGRGSRLDPITRIIPKPLLPIGDKPMLELIMESFATSGFRDFLISINYRKDFIKTWLAERSDLPCSVACVEEEEFLGTAGSIALMKEELKETFFVSNCDILVDVNYASALEFHRENGYSLTIVGALKKVNVPYGVIHLKEGDFDRIEEKPDVPLIVNTGVYVLEPECVALISGGEKIDMPDLIDRLQANGGKVGVFPVHRNWIDIGQWGEYKSALEYGSLRCQDKKTSNL